MQTISTRIAGSEKLTHLLGSWPVFHDAEIVSVELNRELNGAREPNATFQIRLFEKDDNLFVRLLFTGIEDLKLDDFNQQNVIYEMRFTEIGTSGQRVRVEIDTSFGLAGQFSCDQVEIISVSKLPKE